MGLKSYLRTFQTFANKPGEINRIKFDSNYCITDMCEIGGRMQTDKSPLNAYAPGVINCRHGYTPIYDFLFAAYRNKEVNLAEIGIYKGAGLKTFREYFSKAHLYGFEYDKGYVNSAQALKLENTDFSFIDVRTEVGINQALKQTNVLFDIIIDDSTHEVDDQVRILRCGTPFLKQGGIFITEDIYDDNRAHESLFEEALAEIGDQYCFSSFIYPQNTKTDIGNWNNEKILVLIKK